MKPQTSVVFLAMLSLCSGHIGGGSMMQELNSQAQVYCGRNLALVVAKICSLQEGNPDKRADGSMYGSLTPYYKEQEFVWPWLSLHKAQGLSVPSRGKRLIAGIADECCNKSCSLDEILNYYKKKLLASMPEPDKDEASFLPVERTRNDHADAGQPIGG